MVYEIEMTVSLNEMAKSGIRFTYVIYVGVCVSMVKLPYIDCLSSYPVIHMHRPLLQMKLPLITARTYGVCCERP